jgi:hypothetical protein
MIWRSRTRTRIKIAAGAFGCLGLLLWVIAAVVPADPRDVIVDHMMGRSVGVVIGGGSIVGAIALLVAAS